MGSEKKIPPIVQLSAWLLSLIAFAIGFWHTHLGLKEMRPFGSELGGLSLAALVLLLLLLTYWFAINRSGELLGKVGLTIYAICGLVFFICNLNYFYPSYMARQLVKEEAISLNDSLQKFTGKSESYFSSETLSELASLYDLKSKVLFEIKKDGGLGPDAKDYLDKINIITLTAGGKIEPLKLNGNLGATQRDRDVIASNYDTLMDRQIGVFIVQKMVNNKMGNPILVYEGQQQLKSIQAKYSEELKSIIEDDHEINLDSLIYLRQKGDNHPQIKVLQNLVTDIDNATKKINEGNKKDVFPLLKEAETRNLGRIAHTLRSVKMRIGKTDTLVIVFLCLIVDLLVPLAIYLLLRKKGDVMPTNSASGPIKF